MNSAFVSTDSTSLLPLINTDSERFIESRLNSDGPDDSCHTRDQYCLARGLAGDLHCVHRWIELRRADQDQTHGPPPTVRPAAAATDLCLHVMNHSLGSCGKLWRPITQAMRARVRGMPCRAMGQRKGIGQRLSGKLPVSPAHSSSLSPTALSGSYSIAAASTFMRWRHSSSG